MNICFFNSTRFWGGGEKWHFETARYLADRGHTVWVIAHPGGELWRRLKHTRADAVAMAVSNPSFLNPVKIGKLVSFFRRRNIQTLVFNGSAEVKLGAPAATMAGVTARVYRRGLDVPIENSWLNRRLYGGMITHFLTNSQHTARSLHRNLPGTDAARKTRVIYNGIDVSRFSAGSAAVGDPSALRKTVLGTAGRLVAQKGHSHLIDTARHLKESGLDFQLRIAGDGPLMPSLAGQIARFKLEKEVRLEGFVRDMRRFLGQLDIFVFPSLFEGFGYAVAEAMAAGLPVVAFDASSNPELVDDGVTGYLVPAGKSRPMADKILALASDSGLKKAMGRSGRARVAAHFDQTAQMRKLEAYLCDQVLASR